MDCGSRGRCNCFPSRGAGGALVWVGCEERRGGEGEVEDRGCFCMDAQVTDE